jgi:hypothetical protein
MMSLDASRVFCSGRAGGWTVNGGRALRHLSWLNVIGLILHLCRAAERTQLCTSDGSAAIHWMLSAEGARIIAHSQAFLNLPTSSL